MKYLAGNKFQVTEIYQISGSRPAADEANLLLAICYLLPAERSFA